MLRVGQAVFIAGLVLIAVAVTVAAPMWTIRVELAIAALGGLIFMVMYWRGSWRINGPGRMVMAWSAVGVAGAATLLAASFGIQLPVTLFAFGFAVTDAVVIWRLVELLRARRAERTMVDPPPPEEGK